MADDQTHDRMISIPEYYANKTIFLTGGTGFIGKVFLEKVLRSCPKVKDIYCLIRPKRGKNVQERLERLLEGKVFTKLREDQPDFMSKLHAIEGDICEPELGMSDEDKELIQENAQIVVHSAATIRFDEPLKVAIEMNLLGVRKIIHLVKKIKKLEVFVHVSTAYANCDRQFIDEVIYPPPIEPQRLLDAAEWMDDSMMDSVTGGLIGDKPNTYTYTKQLAETLLMEEAQGLPVAILRPSIVTAAWREPLPGWIDNINGPSGLYIAAGKGIMRTMFADKEVVADLIPVDLPVNMLLSVAWYTAVAKPKDVLIYHATTGTLNPFTWGQMEDILMKYFYKMPYDACFRRPNCTITQNSFLHDYWVLVSHMIPAYLLDFGYMLIGKRPRIVKMYQKLHKAMGTLEYFTVRSWEWTHRNMDMLKGKMSEEDIKTFYFDPRSMHWPTYMESYALGTKKYILNEDLKGVPAARAHIRKLRNIRWMFNSVIFVVLWRMFIAKSNIARNSWLFVVSLMYKFVQFFRLTSTVTH